MSIVWFIIKIILFVLIGILLLGGVVITTILLAPIRYDVYFSKYEELVYDIKIRYLLGIKACFYLDKGAKKHRVSLFGKKLYEVNETNASNEDHTMQAESLKIKENNESIMQTITQESSKSPNTPVETKQPKLENKQRKSKNAQAVDIKKMLLDPLTYKAMKRLVQGIWKLLKIIAPKEWDFEVIVGTGEPADTGELIAKLTMLYPMYYQHGIIKGNYEEKCLMGGCLLKGKFRLIQIAILAVSIYLDKHVNAFVHLIKK